MAEALTTVLATLFGIALIAVALRDIFGTLFRPEGKGGVSETLTRAVWAVFRRVARGWTWALSLAGPVALLAVIGNWALLLTLGWAFIFWPQLPEGFQITGIPPGRAGFIEALYLSLVTVTTLGYGDITPVNPVLKVLAPIQALLGFGLLSASLTWVLSIYPAISGIRSLAHKVTLLREVSSEEIVLRDMSAVSAERLLSDLTGRLIGVQSNLNQFPTAYYFHSLDRRFDLSIALQYLLHLSEEASRPEREQDMRIHGRMLRAAIEDFADTLRNRIHNLSPDVPAEKVVEMYARDHLREPER